MGCDDREFRFRSERLGQGAAAALPIWAYFMKRVYADPKTGINPNKVFQAPEGFIDCEPEGAATDPTLMPADPTKEVEEKAGIPEDDQFR